MEVIYKKVNLLKECFRSVILEHEGQSIRFESAYIAAEILDTTHLQIFQWCNLRQPINELDGAVIKWGRYPYKSFITVDKKN